MVEIQHVPASWRSIGKPWCCVCGWGLQRALLMHEEEPQCDLLCERHVQAVKQYTGEREEAAFEALLCKLAQEPEPDSDEWWEEEWEKAREAWQF